VTFLPVEAGFADFAALVWAAVSAGKPNETIAVNRQISRAILKSHAWVTGKPLNLRVLQEVSAL
jgi:hypothetical protein